MISRYLFASILLIIYSATSAQINGSSFEVYGDFKVKKIESVKDNYIIYAIHADTLYKIVSQKTFKINAEKIRKGKTYRWQLISYFNPRLQLPFINSVEVSPGYIVRRLEETKQLYYCKNLTGLYLQPLTHLYYNMHHLIDYPFILGNFQIITIKFTKGVYIIEAVKDSVTYWIASPEEDFATNELKIDSIYEMRLYSYFEKANNFARIINGLVEVRPRTLIKPNPETGQLYFSLDLISNCYLDQPK